MNRWIAPITVVLLGLANNAGALNGSGTEQDPWRITSLADFDEFASDPAYWDDHTRLETDIDLAGRVYERAVIAWDVDGSNVDFDGIPFTGVFNGNGHSVTALTIDVRGGGDLNNDRNDYLGLFGKIQGSGAKIKDVGIEYANIMGGENVASLESGIGGLCGENNGGAITKCYTSGSIAGHSDVGGLCGRNFYGTISECYSTCSVAGDGYRLGGLCGFSFRGAIEQSYATGSVIGGDDTFSLGGLCGEHRVGPINACYATGSVTGGSDVRYLGGLCGDSLGPILRCRAVGRVTGGNSSTKVGGLCGRNGWYELLAECHSTGSVIGGSDVGGLCGWNAGTIWECYSQGSVLGLGDDGIGGLCGANLGGIQRCYTTSSVATEGESEKLGGFCGRNGHGLYDGYGHIDDSCYWDIDASSMSTMCGSEPYGTGCEDSYGKTTAEMHQQSTFTNWDFTHTWDIGENQTYPYLRTHSASDINKDNITNLLDLCILAEQWMKEIE